MLWILLGIIALVVIALCIVPTSAIVTQMATLLSADATTLAPAAGGLKVHLAMANFVPSPTRVIGDFTEATFTGYAALLSPVGACQIFTDASTGLVTIQLKEPANGWHWQTTAATGLPMTIYGYYVSDNASATLYGSALLAAPITLTASAQGIDVAQVRFTLVNNPLT